MSSSALVFLLAQIFLLFNLFWSFTLKNCTMEFSETVMVLCQQRLLQEIPDDAPLNSEVLDVSSNQISQIKSPDLKRLTQLTILLLTQNRLCHIDDEAFVNLKKLKILNLSQNKLTNLTGLVFAGLNTLTSLNLAHNHISQIAPNVFEPLSSLTHVHFHHNYIRNLTDVAAVFSLPNIELVSLSNNRLTSFDSDELPFNSSNIRIISFEYNKVQTFSLKRDIFPHLHSIQLTGTRQFEWHVASDAFLSNVTNISLSRVSLASFSAILSSTPALQDLTLESIEQRSLKQFVQVACLTTSIKTLTLTFLTLQSTDDQLFQPCSRLYELKLPFNNMEQLSNQSLKSLTQLRLLHITHNQLQKVPVTVCQLWTLEELDLSYNSIREISCLDFASLANLTSLSLRRNHIVHLEECYFQKLHSLEKLDLGHNPVRTIESAFRVGLWHLQVLLLNQNMDRFTLRPGAFRNLTSLRVLNLKSTNYIFTLDGVFEGLEKLVRLVSWTSTMTREFFGGLRDLKYLELHIKSFYVNTRADRNSSDEPPFSNLHNLTELLIFVDPAFTVDFSPDLFQGLKSLVSLKVEYFFRASIHPRMFTHTPLLTSLSITNSDFSFLSPEVFNPITKLQTLDLSKNKLNTLHFLGKLHALQMLVVQENRLSIINETLFQTLPSLTYLDLSKNALFCDCLNAAFQEWVRSSNRTQVVGGATYQCLSPVTQSEQRFLDFDTRLCTIDFGFIFFAASSSMTLLTLVISLVYHFLRWPLTYAYNLFLAYLYDTKQRRRNAADRYDAFISYNAHDEEWVYNEMLPVLEGHQGWRLCLHHRDFQPGKPIVENITDAIYSSRKTLCVISRHYLQSEWCSREIQMASVRLFDEHRDVLVLLFLEELSPWRLSPYYRMRRLVKKRSYLSWPRASQHRDVFWQKVQQALQTDAHPDDNHRIVQSEEE
ncbi:toll-like receptor 13 [Periophthalmus magnuspinnatus]|uniref:toll-like receptor 13 n=1 Tax=Periophthalmus magnuspinnatus TaxID=409849 RepID=UPI00145B25B4|nr:toll-like receptor 13 [Periophthalmus magnuspinnatus]